VLKYEHFRINIVVAAYPAFVYVVSRAGRQVDYKMHGATIKIRYRGYMFRPSMVIFRPYF